MRIITHFGTIIFFDTVSQQISHGPLQSSPRNVSIENIAQEKLVVRGPRNDILGEFQIGNFPKTKLVTLALNGKFLCADINGQIRFDRSVANLWEYFLIFDDDSISNLEYMEKNLWDLKSKSDNNAIAVTCCLGEGFYLYFGKRRYNLASEEGLSIILNRTTCEEVGEVSIISNGVISLHGRLYKPMLYMCAFGSEDTFKMLAIFLESLVNSGNYHGNVTIITDRNEEEIRNIIPVNIYNKTKIVKRLYKTLEEFTRARYYLDDVAFEGYQPIVYTDIDMISIGPIWPMLSSILWSNKICFSCEFYDEPNFWDVQFELTHWFGRFLFDRDYDWVGFPSCINSGIFGSVSLSAIRKLIEHVTLLFASRIADTEITRREERYDQPYTSYAAQKLSISDPIILNNFVQILKDGRYVVGDQKYSLVHFNSGVGNSTKLEAMEAARLLLSEVDASKTPQLEGSKNR